MTAWLLAFGRPVTYAVLAVLLWEVVARIGMSVARLFGKEKRDSLACLGIGLLLGWPTLGLFYLGFALTGLFFPVMIMAATLALLCASRALLPARLMLFEALAAWGRAGTWGLAVLAVGTIPLLIHVLVPELDPDCYIYHLGVPWQFLQAHRALLEHAVKFVHYPIPIEMTFALPLAFGADHLTKWVNASFFLAVSVLFASQCIKRGDQASAWLGPLFTLPLLHLCWLLPISKNDVAAAALIVAAIVLHRQRAWLLSATLFGLGLSAKPVAAPFVLVWWLFHPPPFKRWAGLAVCMLLPLVPWLAKSFLATANPIYPFASAWIPTFSWDASNTAVWLECARPLMASHGLGHL